jgi:hypothetical protein
MASYTVAKAKHATLVASTVDTVTVTWGASQQVEVANWGSARLYFTTDGSTPAVGADDTFVVGPGGSLVVPTPGMTSTAVKLICAAANDYSVQAL